MCPAPPAPVEHPPTATPVGGPQTAVLPPADDLRNLAAVHSGRSRCGRQATPQSCGYLRKTVAGRRRDHHREVTQLSCGVQGRRPPLPSGDVPSGAPVTSTGDPWRQTLRRKCRGAVHSVPVLVSGGRTGSAALSVLRGLVLWSVPRATWVTQVQPVSIDMLRVHGAENVVYKVCYQALCCMKI